MKRKPTPAIEPVISEEIIERAKRVLDSEPVRRFEKCVVCGSECAPNSAENICWVCRRLKISAWREGEQQMPAQE